MASVSMSGCRRRGGDAVQAVVEFVPRHELAQVASPSGKETPTWWRPHFGQISVARAVIGSPLDRHAHGAGKAPWPGISRRGADVRDAKSPGRGARDSSSLSGFPSASLVVREKAADDSQSPGRRTGFFPRRSPRDARRDSQARRYFLPTESGAAQVRKSPGPGWWANPFRGFIPRCSAAGYPCLHGDTRPGNRIRTGKIHRPGEGFECRINRLVPRRARSDGGGAQAEYWY